MSVSFQELTPNILKLMGFGTVVSPTGVTYKQYIACDAKIVVTFPSSGESMPPGHESQKWIFSMMVDGKPIIVYSGTTVIDFLNLIVAEGINEGVRQAGVK